MDASESNLNHLRDLLAMFLSPSSAVIKQAEATLAGIETQTGFCLVLLTLVQKLSENGTNLDSRSIGVRQMGAVVFKNLIKKRWAPPDDDDANAASLPASDRAPLKQHLVGRIPLQPSSLTLTLTLTLTLLFFKMITCHD